MKFVNPTNPYRKSGGMGHPKFRCNDESTARRGLLLDDRVVAVGEQLLLDRRSCRAVGKGPHLDVQ